MKKQLLLFLSLIVPTLSFGQLMPDGSVQVVAYWDKGDEFSYKCTNRQERVDDSGKVSLIKSSSEDLIIKVSDQTDSTYTLLLDTKDGFYSDTRVQSYMELLNSLGESSPIQLTTTSMGTVVSYDNLDVLVKETRDMIPKLVDGLLKQYDKATLDDYSALVVHLPTGWPIRYSYERNVVATAKGVSTQDNIYRSIELITD